MRAALISKPVIRASLLASLYFATVLLSLSFFISNQHIALFWPASGVLFALILISNRATTRYLIPLTLVAHCSANLINHTSFAMSLCFSLINVGEACLLVFLFRYLNNGSSTIRSVREVLTFVSVVFAVTSPLSALLGALTVTGFYPELSFQKICWTWWLAVLTGSTIAGIATTNAVRSIAKLSRARGLHVVEAWLCLMAVAVMARLIFDYRVENFSIEPPFLFLCFPLLIWAALRFGTCGAANASLIVAMVASCAAHAMPMLQELPK